MKNLYYLFVVLMFLSQVSCKKLVEIKEPDGFLVSSAVYNDPSTAAAAVTSIYDLMVQDGNLSFTSGRSSLSTVCGLSADELRNYIPTLPHEEFYKNSLTQLNTNISVSWSEFYRYIYISNSAIEGLGASMKIPDALKRQLLGEVKFMRAFLYFYLVNLWGDVPLITGTDYLTNSTMTRTPSAEVFQQIILDLKDAQNLLTDEYHTPFGNTTSERVRPNKFAATALLARVYLYKLDWSNADIESSKIISANSTYSLVSDLNKVFLKNSTEAIWQFQTVATNLSVNTFDGQRFILPSPPSAARPVSLSDQLRNAFELNDNRKNSWIGSLTSGVTTYYYPLKYKIISSPTVTEYTMVLRLAEQYLIRSEAKAQKNDLSAALTDLNIIRRRAGLPDTLIANQNSLLSAILHERQVELFTEWGHRWLDLKRTGTVNTVMSTITQQKGGNWKSAFQLYPLPLAEIQRDPNLLQNPEY